MKIDNLAVLPVGVAIRWDDGEEHLISLQALRDACPCAQCNGESDLLGRRTFGTIPLKQDTSYELRGHRPVGHYAIQFTWGDGHDSGIYNLDLLRKLGAESRED